jgi:hypothetical protein
MAFAINYIIMHTSVASVSLFAPLGIPMANEEHGWTEPLNLHEWPGVPSH